MNYTIINFIMKILVNLIITNPYTIFVKIIIIMIKILSFKQINYPMDVLHLININNLKMVLIRF